MVRSARAQRDSAPSSLVVAADRRLAQPAGAEIGQAVPPDLVPVRPVVIDYAERDLQAHGIIQAIARENAANRDRFGHSNRADLAYISLTLRTPRLALPSKAAMMA